VASAPVTILRVARRAVAADRWPWTWSVLLLVAGGWWVPTAWAPWLLAVGIVVTGCGIEVAGTARRETVQVAGVSIGAVGAIAAVGLSWPLVVALALVAARVGDRMCWPHQLLRPAANRAPRARGADPRELLS
jgi:hypothetical protein